MEVDYDSKVRVALMGAMRDILMEIENGEPVGNFTLYVSFNRLDPDVQFPNIMSEKIITIVLEHKQLESRFWDLEVFEDGFKVTVSLASYGRHEIFIPFTAVTLFTDPSAGFVLDLEKNDYIFDVEEQPPITYVDLSGKDWSQ